MKNLKHNPLVSILLNCFNSSPYISRAIQSVIDQSYKNWELIIWDDGSSDNTVKKIKKFDDSRIKLFLQKKNLGLGSSRIKAIKKIKGSLVSILDSDDFINRHKIKKQVNIFNKNKNISICGTWAKFYDENLNIKKKFTSKLSNIDLKKRLLFVNILPHSSLMYKKESAIKVGWYSKKFEYSQDFDLTLKLLKKNDIYLIKEHLTNITQPLNNMSNSIIFSKIRIKENIKILKNNLSNSNISINEKKILKNLIQINSIKLALSSIRVNFFKSFKNLIDLLLKNPTIIFKLNLIKKLSEIKKI